MGVLKAPRVFLFLPLLMVVVGLVRSALADQLAPFACDPSDPATGSYGFCKTTLPLEQRVDDLVSRLTLEEKVPQLGNAAPGIPRLGIPPYQWWSESLHGVSNWCPGVRFDGVLKSATSFPQVILSAAAFDPQLWYRIGEVEGDFYMRLSLGFISHLGGSGAVHDGSKGETSAWWVVGVTVAVSIMTVAWIVGVMTPSYFLIGE